MIKKCLLAMAVVFTLCSASYAYDCSLFLGMWDIEARDASGNLKSTSVWIIDEADQDRASGIIEETVTPIAISWSEENQEYRMKLSESGWSETDIFITLNDDATFVGSLESAFLPDQSIYGSKRAEVAPAPEECPAQAVLGNDAETLGHLRFYRDEVLAKSPAGQKLIAMYYQIAPSVNAVLAANPLLKQALIAVIRK